MHAFTLCPKAARMKDAAKARLVDSLEGLDVTDLVNISVSKIFSAVRWSLQCVFKVSRTSFPSPPSTRRFTCEATELPSRSLARKRPG